jgi:hypothetical protein
MRNTRILLVIVLFTCSCASYEASVKRYNDLNYESKRVYPEWKPIERNAGKWILPVIGLSAGGFYGYNNDFTYGDTSFEGIESAAIWGGAGLLSGALINSWFFQNRGRRSKDFKISESNKWIRSYNRATNNRYVIHRTEPDNSLIIVPKSRLDDLERYEEAEREREIASIKAEEERIKAQQAAIENRRLQELDNAEKRRNIVKHMRWNPITYSGMKEVFPSAILTATTYAGIQDSRKFEDLSNFIGFSFSPEIRGSSIINFEIEATDGKMITKTVGEIEINGQRNFYPDVNWISQDLLSNKSTLPLKVAFRVSDQAGNFEEKILNLAVLGINECILYENGKLQRWTLPAYVNEQNPLIDEIL